MLYQPIGTAQISDIGAGSSIIERVENSDYETINVVSFVDFLKMEILIQYIFISEYRALNMIFLQIYLRIIIKIKLITFKFNFIISLTKQNKKKEVRKVLKLPMIVNLIFHLFGKGGIKKYKITYTIHCIFINLFFRAP